MELKLINEQGQEASRLEASDALFGREYNEALVHQVLVAYQANARSGNRAQKDRQDVGTRPRSRGARRVPVGRGRACLHHRSGVVAAGSSRVHRTRTSARN
jgi:large subunit ribosomal protein L4